MGKIAFLIITGEISHMFLIVSTTVMGNKTSKWFNAWTTDIFEVLNSSQADLEPAISDGVITKVIPRIRYGKFKILCWLYNKI